MHLHSERTPDDGARPVVVHRAHPGTAPLSWAEARHLTERLSGGHHWNGHLPLTECRGYPRRPRHLRPATG